MNKQLSTTLVFVISASSALAMLDINLPGNSTQSIWANLNGDVYTEPTYPVYLGAGNFSNATDPFLEPIAADSGTAEFTKLSGGGLFFPLSSGGSIYNSSSSGTYTIYDNSPLASLQTVVFQTDAGSAMMFEPTLSYNGASQNLEANFTGEVAGDFATVFAYQWDLSSIVDSITSFEIVWTSPPHNANYAMQLNQGDTFSQSVVPEPETYALIAGIACGLLILKRRNRR